MYKVLLVDDEPLVRDEIRNIVNWKEFNMEIIGESYNGIEALKYIEIHRPDIVLTDIKMPEMDGLQLIQSIRSKDLNTKFIILSAYSDFHMVKEAFKLGVSEYLLKSEITPTSVINAIKNIKEKYMYGEQDKTIIQSDKEVYSHEQLHKLNVLTQDYEKIIKEKFLKDLIDRETIFNESEWINFDFVMKFKENNLAVLIVLIENASSANTNTNASTSTNANANKNAIANVNTNANANANTNKNNTVIKPGKKEILDNISNIVVRHMTGEVFNNGGNEYVIICCFEKIINPEKINEKLKEVSKEILRMANKLDSNIMVSVGISSIQFGLLSISNSYEQAVQALQMKFIKGCGIFSFNDTILKTNNKLENMLNLSEKLTAFKELFISMDTECFSKERDSYCIALNCVNVNDIVLIKKHFLNCYFIIIDFVEQKHIRCEVEDFLIEFDNFLKEYGDLHQLNNWLIRVLDKIQQALKVNNRIVNEVKEYIHTHYNENISLNSIADILDVNRTYISRLFKKNLGVNYCDYVLKLRIENSLKFLNNSNMKVYEIAEKVGFSNVESFSRVFRKITGKSPNNYRNLK